MTTPSGRLDDRRIGPVEDNLARFFELFRNSPALDVSIEPDVTWFTADTDCPILNGVMAARFPSTDAASRAAAVLERLTVHGRPFLWWLTPSTRSSELEQALARHGLEPEEPMPGMYADLGTSRHVGEHNENVRITVAQTPQEIGQAVDAMIAGFEMPPSWAPPMTAALASPTRSGNAQMRHVLARVDGVAVGGGTVAAADGVAGLYNIAVTPGARGHGVGAEITRSLMRIGRDLGCTESILHASNSGFRLYRRLGFEQVCDVQVYSWGPPRAVAASHDAT